MRASIKILTTTLAVLNIFLALTTFLGGIGLLAGWLSMPVNLLQGSIF
jgi:hypothetical protein